MADELREATLQQSACEYLKCSLAGRDSAGKPLCKDPQEYKNAAGESVCGRRPDAIPVESSESGLGEAAPKTHELKCWPESFEAVLQGWKTAEYRLDDRGFRVGDFLLLRRFDPLGQTYFGGEVKVRIRHIYKGHPLPDHFVLLSIEHLESLPAPGLVEAAREILPRLEAIIADGPDCGCEDLGHVCGWREFVVEVGHLRSALDGEEKEP